MVVLNCSRSVKASMWYAAKWFLDPLPGPPEGRLEDLLAVEDGLLLHDRRAFLVRHPAREKGRAHAHGQPDLVAGDRGGRGVEEHGRLVAGGGREGDRVGAEEGLGGEGGNHAEAGPRDV